MNDSLDDQKLVPRSIVKQNQNESQVYLGGQTAWRQSHRHVKLHRCIIDRGEPVGPLSTRETPPIQASRLYRAP